MSSPTRRTAAPLRPDGRRAVLAGLLAAAVVAGGCAAATATRHAHDAERRQDYDLAVVEYGKALQLRPDDAGLRDGLTRAKLRASEDHFTRGRRFEATGKLDAALVELQVAGELNPSNSDIDADLRATREKLRAQAALPREGQTDLEALIARARELPPAGDELPDAAMPASLVFRDAGSRDVFTAIARFADISVIFDPTFQSAPVTLDLRNASLRNALDTVSGATRTFYRITAPRTVAVVPDTPAKRQEYRGRGCADVLPEQRRSQGNRRPAPPGARRPAHFADHGDQRDHHQGHARSRRGGGAPHLRDRQGQARGDHRRRTARGEPVEAGGVRPAGGVAGVAGARRLGLGRLDPVAQRAAQPDAVRRHPGRSALALLPPAQDGPEHAHTREPAAAHVGRRHGAGPLRRRGARARHHVLANRDRRGAATADHGLHLSHHRREHRHHAADAPRR